MKVSGVNTANELRNSLIMLYEGRISDEKPDGDATRASQNLLKFLVKELKEMEFDDVPSPSH